MNQINMIEPYRKYGTWVFDDPKVDLHEEPFVAGIPEMIDTMAGDHDRLRLTFSSEAFPDYQLRLKRREEEHGGTWYELDGGIRGWLCPALLKYFDEAPDELYVRGETTDADQQNTG